MERPARKLLPASKSSFRHGSKLPRHSAVPSPRRGAASPSPERFSRTVPSTRQNKNPWFGPAHHKLRKTDGAVDHDGRVRQPSHPSIVVNRPVKPSKNVTLA